MNNFESLSSGDGEPPEKSDRIVCEFLIDLDYSEGDD